MLHSLVDSALYRNRLFLAFVANKIICSLFLIMKCCKNIYAKNSVVYTFVLFIIFNLPVFIKQKFSVFGIVSLPLDPVADTVGFKICI